MNEWIENLAKFLVLKLSWEKLRLLRWIPKHWVEEILKYVFSMVLGIHLGSISFNCIVQNSVAFDSDPNILLDNGLQPWILAAIRKCLFAFDVKIEESVCPTLSFTFCMLPLYREIENYFPGTKVMVSCLGHEYSYFWELLISVTSIDQLVTSSQKSLLTFEFCKSVHHVRNY